VDSFDGFDRGTAPGVAGRRGISLQYYTMTAPSEPELETCDVCGSTDLWWRNCKLLCRNCGSIVKSCSDL
jgi:hypothetical protein